MSASSYQQLMAQVLVPEHPELQTQLSPLYQDFEQALKEARPGRASQEQVNYRFERLRLGVGILLLQLLTDLGGDEDSAQVRDLLIDALQAPTIGEIDRVIQQKGHLFEDLYTELYVNAEAEIVLSHFEGTLNASSQEEMEDIIEGALDLALDLEFTSEGEEEPGPDSE